MKTYFGIVDALGLESFIEFDERQERKTKREFTLLELRAKFNPQRNAVAYKIELPDADIKKIVKLIGQGLFVEAGQIVTRYLDSANGTKLTEINKHLQTIQKLRGYL